MGVISSIRLAPMALLIGIALITSLGCGDDEEPGGNGAGTDERGVVRPDAEGNLAVTAGDNWFVSEGDQRAGRVKIVLKAGQQVDITMDNTGGAIHNLRFAGYDGEYDTDDDLVTDPEAVKSGDSGSFAFTADEAGSFPFQCDFHQGEMTGEVVVE